MQLPQPPSSAHDRLAPSPSLLHAGSQVMESYLRAGQRWLSESDVAAKLDFCSLLGIPVKAPPKEGGGKLLEGVLIPFASLKPLFDRLEDSEVTQRLAHLQPAVIGKDLNQRRELATIYRKIVEWCRGPHFTPEHLATLGRYLGIPASASKEQILTGFLYSFIFSASSPHLGYTSHITLNAGDIVPLSLTPHAAAAATSITATTASSARSSSPPPPTSFGSTVHTATSTKKADSPNSMPLVRVKQEPRDEDLDTDGGLARLAGGVEVKRERQSEGHMFDQLSSHFETDAQDSNKRRRIESTPTGAATADDAAQERSMAGRRSLKRPLPSALPPPSSSSSTSSAPASGPRASSGPAASAFAPLPSPFSQPLFAGPGGSSAMPIHPLYLSALQSAAPLTPQMLASLTGLPLIYPLPGSSPTPFIQPKPSSVSAAASSSTGAPSALSSSSSSVPVSTATAQHSKATGKYTPIQPASGGGYPPILPLPPILPFPSNAGSNGPMMPQHLSSSAPSVATLKRKAEKEAEEEKRRPLSRTAPVRGGGKGTASGSAVQSTVPLPGIGSFPSSSSSPTSASMTTGSDASAANSTAAAASVLAFTSALASVTSLSPPSPSSFDTPFCSSFTEASSDSNPFSGATQGPFSPFSPLFASPTSYSSTVIPSTGAGSSGGTPSSLFSLSASSAPSAIDVDLIGSESGNHGSRYYYGAPFPEIEAFDVAGEKKLDYLNVDVIVVPKEESSTNNGGKAAGDPSSPTRSGRGGRGSGRGRGRSGGLGRSTEGDNARGTLTASRGSSSTTMTTTASSGSAERGTRSGSARSKGAGGSRAMTATHPVYDASQGASPGSTLPPYVPPKIRPTPVKPAVSPPRRARPAAADTSVGAPKVSTPKRTSATTPTPTSEEAKRSEDEYITAELLMSLGFGKDRRSTSSTPMTARVEEQNEREEDEDRNNSDGPLLETNPTPAAVVKSNGNAVAPDEAEDDEPELCIAEEDDDDDDEEKNDEARGARGLNDKKRKREQGPETGAGELRGPANGKSPRTDHDHQPHHHQPAPLMRAQAL